MIRTNGKKLEIISQILWKIIKQHPKDLLTINQIWNGQVIGKLDLVHYWYLANLFPNIILKLISGFMFLQQNKSLNLLNLYNPMAYFGKHKRVRPHWWNSNCKITKYLNKLKALAILITLFEIKLAPKACTMLLPMLYFTLALPSSIPKLVYIDKLFFTLWFRRKQK